jgi:hypothetical protein
MSYLETVRSTFLKEGYTLRSYISRVELERFLNSLIVSIIIYREEKHMILK